MIIDDIIMTIEIINGYKKVPQNGKTINGYKRIQKYKRV